MIIVGGGGNTAIDCARTCLRMGVSETFHCLSKDGIRDAGGPGRSRRRARQGLPPFLTQPVEILALNKKMTGLKCIRMELGDADKSGRKRPVPVFSWIDNLSLRPTRSFLRSGKPLLSDFSHPKTELKLPPPRRHSRGSKTMMTSRSGVFAAGDRGFRSPHSGSWSSGRETSG